MSSEHAAFWERHRTELWDRVFQAADDVSLLADSLAGGQAVGVARDGLLKAAFGVGVALVQANAADERAVFVAALQRAMTRAVATDYWLRLLTVVGQRDGLQRDVAGLLAHYGAIVTLLRKLEQHVIGEPDAVARHTKKGPRV